MAHPGQFNPEDAPLAELAAAGEAAQTDERPLVWTKLGNLPMADLDFDTEWSFRTDEETGVVQEIVCNPIYRLKRTGEVVSRGAYVWVNKPKDGEIGATQGTIA